jgi:TolA-binding protein
MKVNSRVIEAGDQLHDVQRRIRDLSAELKELERQESRLKALALQVTKGHDTKYASSDGFVKLIEIHNEPDEDVVDVPAMIATLQKLNRRIPLKSGFSVVVRYMTVDDE